MKRAVTLATVSALGLAVTVAIPIGLSGPGPFAVTPAAAQADESSGRSVVLEDPGTPDFSTAGWETDFGISAVPFDQILSGGPGKDGIPAIDQPRFESIDEARTWVSAESPVIALEVDGDARAYPLAILTWHEIVNDTVGGEPVIVTFCPLCHTGLVYERTLDGAVHDFGVSGKLRFSDMIMYDRQTETWWQQATGQAIVGGLTGAKLGFVPSQIIGLDQFAAAYPEGVVLSRDTGHSRDYGRNPYVGYDTVDQQPFLFDGVTDGRLPPKERVVTLGSEDSEAPLAIPHSELRSNGVAQVVFEDQPLVALWQPGAVSALDAASIDASEDVGAAGVFSAVVDGEVLSFSRAGGPDSPITDVQTGSSWDVTGRAIDGPLRGTALEPFPHADTFWFAWAAFVPHTSIWTHDGIISLAGEG